MMADSCCKREIQFVFTSAVKSFVERRSENDYLAEEDFKHFGEVSCHFLYDLSF